MLRRLCRAPPLPGPLGPRARASHLLPPTQYDVPLPNRLKLTYACVKYWEIIPTVMTSCFSMSLAACYCIYMTIYKVDTTFTHRRGDNASRTMDLRTPRCFKMITVNQRYRPWPEMQDALDAMKAAEKKQNTTLKGGHCS